jgi:2-(1,2-epoxy-1,2-dihydrophenyl)acetyl-CoA isomerase
MATGNAESTVLLEIDDGLARIILNRPHKYNAMNMQLALELQAAVAEISHRPDVAVVALLANGPAFCAGGDVGPMADVPDLQAYFTDLAVALHGAIGQLSTLPLVVVVGVQGVVAGGGMGLVLSGDLVIVGDDATFTPAYSSLGFTPDCGVTKHLPQAVGLQRALQYSVGGRKLTADDALEWGLAFEVVPTADVRGRTLELAARIRDSAPAALGETRQLMRSSFDRDLQSSLDLEAETIVSRSAGAESVALVARFTAARGTRP